MPFLRSTPNDKARRSKNTVLGISVIFYLILIVILGRSSNPEQSHVFLGYSISSTAIKGVITQIQMLILVFMVLQIGSLGYWVALVLNIISLTVAIAYVIQTNSMFALPGVIAYIGVFLILSLIHLHRRKIKAYMKENDLQREELMASEDRLTRMVYYDGLTGLPNRTYFVESLSRDISLSKRTNTLLSVIFIDLDSFKNINDTLGHNAGDEALVKVTKRISSVMRNEDVLSRFGGDEFLMKAGSLQSIDDVNIIAEKIIGVFQKALIIEDMEFFTTASIGISVYPYDGESVEKLIKNADMAMYLAKKKGKNQYAFCSKEMRENSKRRLSLTNRLYKAIEKNELHLLYQPQLRVGTKKIAGFEALLRWNDDKYGPVSPGEFIPIAEHTGMIRPIGLWVLKEVCLQYKKWKDSGTGNIRMSVNMSVEQLKDDGIIEQVGNVLKETGVSARALEIEITESAAFSESCNIIDKLTELRNMGFQIAIDDFGKEYSSLNRIRTFPVDRLKIDMDFIHGISTGDSRDRAVVKTIIQLAVNLGVHVIAEGVENQEQYEFLEKESCDEVQGFLFFKGMRPEELETLVSLQAPDIRYRP